MITVWHVTDINMTASNTVYVSHVDSTTPAEAEGATRSPPVCLPGTYEGYLPSPRLLRGLSAPVLELYNRRQCLGSNRRERGAGLETLDKLLALMAQAKGAWFSQGASRC